MQHIYSPLGASLSFMNTIAAAAALHRETTTDPIKFLKINRLQFPAKMISYNLQVLTRIADMGGLNKRESAKRGFKKSRLLSRRTLGGPGEYNYQTVSNQHIKIKYDM